MVNIGIPETSVSNHLKPSNNPEDGRIIVHHRNNCVGSKKAL